MQVWKWSCSDVEVEQQGYFLASNEEDARQRIKNIALTEESLEIEFIMDHNSLEELLVRGSCESYYSDWDD